jgi:hypothetical protein
VTGRTRLLGQEIVAEMTRDAEAALAPLAAG